MKTKNVLIVGADLYSNGGIASVVKSYYSEYLKTPSNLNLRLLKTNYYKDKGLLSELFIFILAFFKALYLIGLKNIHILHIHSSAQVSFYRKSFFVLLGKIFRRKIILHLHSSDFYNFFLSDRWIVKTVLHWSDIIIVLCNDWEKELHKKYPKLTIVKVENPFEGHRVKLDVSSEQQNGTFKILFVGFFIESKGIRDLIQIGVKLKIIGINDVEIHIAGKGELARFIENAIEEYNLSSIIKLKGWISGNNKEEAYRDADAFILPSYKEGMPISILEAMSYGLPIISTNIAGIPDIVTPYKNGFLITPGNIKGFIDAIMELKSNYNLQKLMRYNNLIRVEDNSGKNIFNQIVKIYNEV